MSEYGGNGNGHRDRGRLADVRVLVGEARRDPAAFEALYLHYVDRVFGFLMRRSGSRDVAEEVTAATFESVLQSLAAFDPDVGCFEAWLFRLAGNRLADYYRRERRMESPRGQRAIAVLTCEDTDHLASDLERARDREVMHASLNAISSRYRQAIELRYLRDLSLDDAAAAMGCSKATMAVTVHRALGSLRQEMATRNGQ